MSKYFAINIYSFKLSIFGTALDIIMFKKWFFSQFFLHLLPMKKKTPVHKWRASDTNMSFVKPTNSTLSTILDQNSLAVLYIVHVV